MLSNSACARLRRLCVLALCFAALSVQAQSKTKVVPGSSAGYVYSPGGAKASNEVTTNGCSTFKFAPGSYDEILARNAVDPLKTPAPLAYTRTQFENLQIAGWGTVTNGKFSGLIHRAGYNSKKSTYAAPGDNTANASLTRYGRCTESWTGSAGTAGEGRDACVYYLVSSYLTFFYYVEVTDLPVSEVAPATCPNPETLP